MEVNEILYMLLQMKAEFHTALGGCAVTAFSSGSLFIDFQMMFKSNASLSSRSLKTMLLASPWLIEQGLDQNSLVVTVVKVQTTSTPQTVRTTREQDVDSVHNSSVVTAQGSTRTTTPMASQTTQGQDEGLQDVSSAVTSQISTSSAPLSSRTTVEYGITDEDISGVDESQGTTIEQEQAITTHRTASQQPEGEY